MNRKIVIWFCLVILFLGCIAQKDIYADEAISEENTLVADGSEYELIHYNLDEVPVLYSGGKLENIQNIVVFIRFADSEEYIDNVRVGYADQTYNKDTQSLRQYIGRISYGAMDVVTSFYPCEDGNYYSVQLSKSADYYKKQYTKSDGTLSDGYTSYTERIERERAMVQEVLGIIQPQIEAAGHLLDDDGNGTVDGIAFVVPTRGNYAENNISYGDLLWPHKISGMNTGVVLNGAAITTYNILGIGTETTGIAGSQTRQSRTLIHEFMHILGVPDLYRYSSQSAYPLGPWDIMDSGTQTPVNLNAYYQREYLGYGKVLDVISESSKDVTLTAASYENSEEAYAVILMDKSNQDEIFVVEYRQIEASEQLNEGLLVYRVNLSEDAPSPSEGNKNANGLDNKDFIYAFRPGESGYNQGGGYIQYATLSPDNAKGFVSLGKEIGLENDGYDNGIIYYSDGSNSGIVIDNLRQNGHSMVFDITFTKAEETELPEYTAVEQFIVRLYKNILGRDPDDDGLADWTNKLLTKEYTGAQVAEGFIYSDELEKMNLSDEDYVDILYATFLNRIADAEGKTYWLHRLANGVSRSFVFEGFVESEEFTKICKKYEIDRGNVILTEPRDQNANVTMFVFRCYIKSLGRKPDVSGLNDWTGRLLANEETPEDVAYGFIFSSEFEKKKLSNEDYIKVLYETFLDRVCDEEGLCDWLERLEQGASRYQVFEGFVYSDEFKKIIKSFGL